MCIRDRVRDAVLLRAAPVVAVRFVSRGRGAHLGLPRSRRALGGRVFVKCDQWIAFDRDLAAVVLRDLAAGMPLRRLFERSIIPDESAIQTALHAVEPPTIPHPVSFVPVSYTHLDVYKRQPPDPRLTLRLA